jgi:3-dehydroquinate synthase
VKRVLDLGYPVLCGARADLGLTGVWDPGWSRAVLIGDDNTDRLFGDAHEQALGALGAAPLRLRFPAGEANKTRATKETLEDAMLRARIDRQACIVAVGGGVVLDLAGFVAATYMRGIAHINVATTLLAQVDAAIGGKTAVNTATGKNLIGAFHEPRAVLLDTGALDSLSDDELRSGLAEMIKHAVLADEALFETIERWAAARASLRPPDDVVARSAIIKAEIVADDPRERGRRHLLNFGHTVAHAIEHATAHGTPHGHAVAIGMLVEASLAEAEGAFPSGDLARLTALCAALGLPTRPPCSFAEAEGYFASDKKNRDDRVHCAIPVGIGECAAFKRPVELAALERAWERACSA